MAFKKGQNPNHPKRGSAIAVEPIRDLAAIARIKENLLAAGQYRNYCLFVLGINTAWRASELLSIHVGQVRHLDVGDALVLKQCKTGRYRRTPVNEVALDALKLWLAHHPRGEDTSALLFPSDRRGRLGVPALCNLVKLWCRRGGAWGRFGSHTLRKTWGYHQRVSFAAPLTLISRALGHVSERQTLAYVGIQPPEVSALFMATL
ncbi:tyrosine-type recombinase/integrase [Algiphilus sp. W345]|uniref:Tyrosine-type recombinase/integrase n=1 Tax=Banduia mediterranea TaxID=3075609 RepID=A0ABU2WMT3_9GAMM|nr:tyrosine-type recombinase/integrase [Algiphilus sp. W345]MDT0499192.1 tyrosine-type recombinase/integrase [Algiphilus sp. W345]